MIKHFGTVLLYLTLLHSPFTSSLSFMRLARFPPIRRPNESLYKYETKYIDLFIDHFSFTDLGKFKLKYLISTESFQSGGPIFFYTGNEGSIEVFAENAGFLWETAVDLHAAVVFAEHRYYGESLPFGNDTFKNKGYFGYLTAEQALADYAILLTTLKTEQKFKDSPVIAFGGSYGGILAAWFRMKYPNLINGAIASSAPVWMFPSMSDCGAFAKTTTQTFSACKELVQSSWDSIRAVTQMAEGRELLAKVFHLCAPLENEDPLIDYLVGFLGTVAMVDYPYEASFMGHFPAFPVKVFCDSLGNANVYHHVVADNESPITRVQRLSQAVRSLTNFTKQQSCIKLEPSLPDIDTDAWTIQTCMEMTIPTCSDGVNDMFPSSSWDPEAYTKFCEEKYGVSPRMDWIGIQFWKKKLETVENVVFSNGDLDPWSALGVLSQSDAPYATVLRIPNGAHHLDLRAANTTADPADVVKVRQEEVEMIKKWIA